MKESSSRLSVSSTTDDIGMDIENTASSHCYSPNLTPQSLSHDLNSFKKSKAPSRILSYRNEAWVDVPRQVFDELSAGFVAGIAVIKLSVNGARFVFDFVRMIQVDLLRKSENSIAWIDVDGRCFFPKMVIQPSVNEPRFLGTEALSDDEKLYKVVETLFLNGMNRTHQNATVMIVHKCLYSGSSEKLRLRTFRMMTEMMKAERGNANVRFGWYGASAESAAGVVKHGFGKTNDGMLGDEAHGVGVHLSPPHFPYASSLLSEADNGGVKHIVLCRVIMGNSERVDAGSAQYHPSSDEFDSGVDHLTNPKWYIVWSTHMNTHILPDYIVSFKTSNQHQGSGLRPTTNSMRRPYVTSGLSFQKLLSELARSLPTSSMQALGVFYNKHKAGKLSKDEFIRYLRSVAGDKLLASIIKKRMDPRPRV